MFLGLTSEAHLFFSLTLFPLRKSDHKIIILSMYMADTPHETEFFSPLTNTEETVSSTLISICI